MTNRAKLSLTEALLVFGFFVLMTVLSVAGGRHTPSLPQYQVVSTKNNIMPECEPEKGSIMVSGE
jgi:hypothetical protein